MGRRRTPVLPAPLPPGKEWTWSPRDAAWIRIYHQDFFTPSATHRRQWGPKYRFDHHTPGPGRLCPDKRTVIYLASDLEAAAAEVFGDMDPFGVCPHWRIAWLRPTGSVTLQKLTRGGAMALGAKPELGSGASVPYPESQEAARRIWADHPHLHGILYTGSHQEGACMVLTERAHGIEIVTDAGVEQEFSVTSGEIWDRLLTDYVIPTSYTLDKVADSACRYCSEAAKAASA